VLTLSYASKDVYFGGRVIWQNGKAVVQDRLGSVMARGNGSGVGGLDFHDYFPYGEEKTATVGDRNKFGTYHRDQTGLDYADQRYYNSAIGRFMSSDPYEASGGAAEPGSWGRGVYVENDPANKADPTGLYYGWADSHLNQFEVGIGGGSMWGGGFGCAVSGWFGNSFCALQVAPLGLLSYGTPEGTPEPEKPSCDIAMSIDAEPGGFNVGRAGHGAYLVSDRKGNQIRIEGLPEENPNSNLPVVLGGSWLNVSITQGNPHASKNAYEDWRLHGTEICDVVDRLLAEAERYKRQDNNTTPYVFFSSNSNYLLGLFAENAKIPVPTAARIEYNLPLGLTPLPGWSWRWGRPPVF